MGKKLEIALCGCRGHIERFGTLINMHRAGNVCAVWDTDAGSARQVAESFHVPYFTDYDELISVCHPDGVVITAPNLYHKDLILKAAAAGIHIFVEKPLCSKEEDALEIQKVIHESSVKFYMSDPFVLSGIIELKRLIQEGVIGEVTGGRVRMCTDSAFPRKDRPAEVDYRRELHGGGIMSDIGGHVLHIVQYLFGCPQAVSATFSYFTESARQNQMEEAAVYAMKYPHDIIITGESSWLSPYFSTITEVFGTKGHAVVKDVNRRDNIQQLTYTLVGQAPVTMQEPELPPHPTLHVQYWLDMIDRDLPNEIIGMDDMSNNGVGIDNAVELVRLAAAIYESAQTGSAVKLY